MNSSFAFNPFILRNSQFAPLTTIQASFTFYQRIEKISYRKKLLIISKESLYISQNIEENNEFSKITYDSKFEIIRQGPKLHNIQLIGIKFSINLKETREFYTESIQDFEKLRILLKNQMNQTSLQKFYRPLKKIYSGDYFSYYSAIRIEDQKNVIIKSHSKQYAFSALSWEKKIFDQIKILKILRQNQFNLLIEIFQSDVSLYFILDIPDCCPLSKYFKNLSSKSFQKIKRIIFEIVSQIKFLNSIGITLDLQFQNIFVLEDCTDGVNVKLVNFENAKYNPKLGTHILNQNICESNLINQKYQKFLKTQCESPQNIQNIIQIIKFILETKIQHTTSIKNLEFNYDNQIEQQFIIFISQISQIDQIINHTYFRSIHLQIQSPQNKLCRQESFSTADSLSQKSIISPCQILNQQQINHHRKVRYASFEIQKSTKYMENCQGNKKSKFRGI